jgi:hypothetical protein
MWELLAPIIRWPLYSPARFLTVVVVALVAVFVIGEVNDRQDLPVAATGSRLPTANQDETSAAPAATPGATPSDSAATPADTAPTHDDAPATDELSVDPAQDDPSAAAADAAAAFVAAWARPDLSPKAWAAGVRPLATAELWSTGLKVTDPTRTPPVTVRGEPRQVAMNAEEGVFDVPTTGAWIRVHVTRTPAEEEWLVSSVEPAE